MVIRKRPEKYTNSRKYIIKNKSHMQGISNKLSYNLFTKQGHAALPVENFKAKIKLKVEGNLIKTNEITRDYLLTIGEINKRIIKEKVSLEYKEYLPIIKRETIVKIITKVVQDRYLSLKDYENIDKEKIITQLTKVIKKFDLSFIYNA
jgi:hypothetical protein